MKASSKRILSILFSAVLLLGTLVVYGSFIQPEISAASDLQSLIASKTNLLNGQKTAVAQVSQLIGQFQNAASLQQTVSLALPLNPNTTGILNQWQAIAQSAGVILQSLNVQPAPVGGTAAATSTLVKKSGAISIAVTAAGSYPALKQFLQSLETNVRVTNVNSFEVNPLQGGGQNQAGGVYALQANVSAFYQTE